MIIFINTRTQIRRLLFAALLVGGTGTVSWRLAAGENQAFGATTNVIGRNADDLETPIN